MKPLFRSILIALFMAGAIILFNALFVMGIMPQSTARIRLVIFQAFYALLIFCGIGVFLTRLMEKHAVITCAIMSLLGSFIFIVIQFSSTIRDYSNLQGLITSGALTSLIEVFCIYTVITFIASMGLLAIFSLFRSSNSQFERIWPPRKP